MCEITDFYQYKYSRGNYFINIIISIETAYGINLLLKEKLKQKKLRKDYRCAYLKLKEKINEIDMDLPYVKLRLNKCYLLYLKDLYYDYYDREESLCVKEVIHHLQYFIEEDGDNLYKFYDLVENRKINILLSN